MRRFALLVLLLGAVWTQTSAVCTGRVSTDNYIGDLAAADYVFQSDNGAGWVTLPNMQIGGAYLNFDIDVYGGADLGCLFSFVAAPGTAATAAQQQALYMDAYISGGKLYFQTGSQQTETFNVWVANKWNRVTVAIDQTVGVVTLYINGQQVGQRTGLGNIAQSMRKGYIGLCPIRPSSPPSGVVKGLNGKVDNFIISTEPKSTFQINFEQSQFFPVVPENGLVAYYDFNKWGAATNVKALVGTAANPVNLDGTIIGTHSRVLRGSTASTDKQCSFAGGVTVDATGKATAPFYGVLGGGYTKTFQCSTSGGQGFTFGQKWNEKTGLEEVSVFASVDHRFRINLAPSGLNVLHQNWGGWEKIGITTEYVEDDLMTIQIEQDAFKLQVGGYGWIRIYNNDGVIAYDYALVSTTCNGGIPRPDAMCAYDLADVTVYSFAGTPLPEPMGPDAVGAGGLGGGPDVLACPSPGDPCPGWYCGGTDIYRPDAYCPNAVNDVRCCDYSAAYHSREVCRNKYPDAYCDANPNSPWCCTYRPSNPICLEYRPDLYCVTSAGRANDACCTKSGFECQNMCFQNYPSSYCNCPHVTSILNAAASTAASENRCCPWRPSLNYCASQQPPSPPPPPPSPVVDPPFTPSNPCSGIQASDVNLYNSIVASCDAIWGATDSNERRQCIAVSCTLGDDVPPKPDCATARLLKQSNPSYPLPAQCTTGCPNGCSFHGTCQGDNTCACTSEWSGVDCSIPKKYPCWTLSNQGQAISVDPVAEIYRFSGTTTRTYQLTPQFTAYTVQQFNAQYAPRIPDSVLITPVYTLSDWTTRTKNYHLWITAGDARTNTGSGSATVTISGTHIQAGTDKIAIVTAGSGTTGRCKIGAGSWFLSTSSYTSGDITCEMAWASNGQVSVALIGLTPGTVGGAASAFSVTAVSSNPVLVASTSRSREQIVEIIRQVPTVVGGTTHVLNFGNNNCQAPAACNTNDCGTCAAAPECGWCIEMNACMPGNAAGPVVGTCLNWRYSFSTGITRRLTQIPGFPSNPGTTDVFTSTTDSSTLPVDLSVVIQPHNSIPWDVAILSTFHDNNREAWKVGLNTLRGKLLSGFPNSGIAFAALVPPATQAIGYQLLTPLTNPNANNNFDWLVAKCNTGCASSGNGPSEVYAKKALYSFGDPANNDFKLRLGFNSRRVVTLFAAAPISASDTTSVAEIRLRLLNKNAVPVFVVTPAVRAGYDALVAQLGFGAVFPLDASWAASGLADQVIAALMRVSYQVSLTHTAAAGNTVLDVTAFNNRISSYTINGLQADTRNGLEYRARMILPVKNNAADGVAIGAAQLYVPGFSSAVIEDVPTDLPTFKGAVSVYNVDEDDDNGVVIMLPGESFRNLLKVVPKVTFTSKIGGTFHRLYDGIKNGAQFYGAGDAFDPLNQYIPEGAIVYVPPTDVTNSIEGTTYGQNFATVKYTLTDACSTSATTFTITINVNNVNFPPFANVIPAHGPEYTPIIINLDGSDRDGDELEYFISNGVRDSSIVAAKDAGKLYQYYDNFDPLNPNNAMEISAPDTKVTSGTRIIYMPPRFKHSFADPASQADRLLIPCVSYYVKEKNTAAKLASPVVDVPITIDHVNNAPWVWNDADRLLGGIAGTWSFPEAFPSAAQGVNCWAGMNAPVCVWEEDFGEEYWWMTGFRFIHMGGFDIDGGRLDIEVTSLDCYPGATIQVMLAGSELIQVGSKIVNQDNGMLIPALRFRPVKETHNAMFAGRGYYCKVGYRVRDDQDALSLNEGSVTISITDVNKQPRLESYENEFTAYEEVPYSFQLEVDDPELDAFTTTLVGCEQPRGTFQFCLDEFCQNLHTVDCAAQTPQVIPPTANSKYPIGIFTSGRLESPSDGIQYNVLSFKFQDSVSKFAARPFKVTFNVIRLNTPPVITVDGEVADQHLRSTDFDATFAAQFDVNDKDIAQGYITITVSLDSSKAEGALLDTTYAAQFATLIKKDDGSVFTFQAELAEAKKAIAVISVSSPVFDAQKYPDGVATAVLRVTANDQGNSGQCPTDTYLRLSNCPLETTTAVVISWVKPSDNRAAMIGGSAAAAGFGVLAIAAAAVAFKRMQSGAAKENYLPWDENEEPEEVAVNPLYEGSGLSGTNALYDASDAFNPVANNKL
jgi:hypothetical protein